MAIGSNNGDLDLGFEMKDEFKPKETPTNEEESATPSNEEAQETAPADEKPEEEVIEEKKEEVVEDEKSPANEKPEDETQEETKAEENKEEETVEEEEQAQEPESSLKDISESTNGEFKTVDELYEAYQTKSQQVDGKTVMEIMNEKIEEEYGEGVTYSQLIAFKSRDYGEMSNLELIKESIKFNDPDITDEQLEAELFEFDLMKLSQSEKDAMIENGDLTEREYQTAKSRMISKARQAKLELQEAQNAVDLDSLEITVPSINVEQQPQKTPEELQEELDGYSKQIHSFKDFEVEVGSKENPQSVKISITDKDRNGMQELLFPSKDGRNWIDRRWVGADGKINMDKLLMDVHKMENYERDVKLAYTQGGNTKIKQEVKDIDNINLDNKKGTASADHEKRDVHAEVADRIN